MRFSHTHDARVVTLVSRKKKGRRLLCVLSFHGLEAFYHLHELRNGIRAELRRRKYQRSLHGLYARTEPASLRLSRER